MNRLNIDVRTVTQTHQPIQIGGWNKSPRLLNLSFPFLEKFKLMTSRLVCCLPQFHDWFGCWIG